MTIVDWLDFVRAGIVSLDMPPKMRMQATPDGNGTVSIVDVLYDIARCVKKAPQLAPRIGFQYQHEEGDEEALAKARVHGHQDPVPIALYASPGYRKDFEEPPLKHDKHGAIGTPYEHHETGQFSIVEPMENKPMMYYKRKEEEEARRREEETRQKFGEWNRFTYQKGGSKEFSKVDVLDPTPDIVYQEHRVQQRKLKKAAKVRKWKGVPSGGGEGGEGDYAAGGGVDSPRYLQPTKAFKHKDKKEHVDDHVEYASSDEEHHVEYDEHGKVKNVTQVKKKRKKKRKKKDAHRHDGQVSHHHWAEELRDHEERPWIASPRVVPQSEKLKKLAAVKGKECARPVGVVKQGLFSDMAPLDQTPGVVWEKRFKAKEKKERKKDIQKYGEWNPATKHVPLNPKFRDEHHSNEARAKGVFTEVAPLDTTPDVFYQEIADREKKMEKATKLREWKAKVDSPRSRSGSTASLVSGTASPRSPLLQAVTSPQRRMSSPLMFTGALSSPRSPGSPGKSPLRAPRFMERTSSWNAKDFALSGVRPDMHTDADAHDDHVHAILPPTTSEAKKQRLKGVEKARHEKEKVRQVSHANWTPSLREDIHGTHKGWNSSTRQVPASSVLRRASNAQIRVDQVDNQPLVKGGEFLSRHLHHRPEHQWEEKKKVAHEERKQKKLKRVTNPKLTRIEVIINGELKAPVVPVVEKHLKDKRARKKGKKGGKKKKKKAKETPEEKAAREKLERLREEKADLERVRALVATGVPESDARAQVQARRARERDAADAKAQLVAELEAESSSPQLYGLDMGGGSGTGSGTGASSFELPERQQTSTNRAERFSLPEHLDRQGSQASVTLDDMSRCLTPDLLRESEDEESESSDGDGVQRTFDFGTVSSAVAAVEAEAAKQPGDDGEDGPAEAAAQGGFVQLVQHEEDELLHTEEHHDGEPAEAAEESGEESGAAAAATTQFEQAEEAAVEVAAVEEAAVEDEAPKEEEAAPAAATTGGSFFEEEEDDEGWD